MKPEFSSSSANATKPGTEQSVKARAKLELKKILVPVDFSDRSKNALQYATLLAKQFDSAIIFLHAITNSELHERNSAQNQETALMAIGLQEEAKQRVSLWINGAVPPEIPVQIESCVGIETVAIVNVAKDLKIDLIVVSTHGRLGRAHELAGSKAENIVQHAPCPVLVVRDHL